MGEKEEKQSSYVQVYVYMTFKNEMSSFFIPLAELLWPGTSSLKLALVIGLILQPTYSQSI